MSLSASLAWVSRAFFLLGSIRLYWDSTFMNVSITVEGS